MQTPRAWRILGITEVQLLNEKGKFEGTTTVRFMVGEHGPFQLQVPSATFTMAGVAPLIDAKAAEIVALDKLGSAGGD